MAESVSKRISEQYPFLTWLANDPQVGPLLRRAVDVNRPYSAERFQAELMNTPFWRRNSDAQKEWGVIKHTRPGEMRRRLGEYTQQLQSTASQLGVKLTGPELRWIAGSLIAQGYDPTGLYVRSYLMSHAGKKGFTKRIHGGEYMTNRQKIDGMSADYFRKTDWRSARKWATAVTLGNLRMDDIETRFRNEAMKRYPHMADGLKRGMSITEIIGPNVDLIAQELEITPQDITRQISRRDAAFTPILGVRDPKTRQMRTMTASEAQKLARERSSWWSTANGQRADASMASTLLNIFGKRRVGGATSGVVT